MAPMLAAEMLPYWARYSAAWSPTDCSMARKSLVSSSIGVSGWIVETPDAIKRYQIGYVLMIPVAELGYLPTQHAEPISAFFAVPAETCRSCQCAKIWSAVSWPGSNSWSKKKPYFHCI
jgi:hypothetical protein